MKDLVQFDLLEPRKKVKRKLLSDREKLYIFTTQLRPARATTAEVLLTRSLSLEQ